ncbi:hypothetical protein FACS189437_03160 [Bacteroidia bacterium]|nr:hypothetical protein FACS189437_03160 [Bacteroidia bacterium]
MDIIKKLQLVLWVLSAVLISMPLLDYFGVSYEDALRKVLFLPPAEHKEKQDLKPEYVEAAFGITPPAAPEGSQQPAVALHPAAPETQARQTAQLTDIAGRITGLENYAAFKNNPDETTPSVPSLSVRQTAADKVRWIGPPFGFFTKETYRFMIYREYADVTPKISGVLDTVQGNLVLDLLPFTMVKTPDKILIMLFGSADSYSNFTKRPPWSGASSNLSNDTLYVIENSGFYPLTVHELTHLYFDGFFLPVTNPLWLSEGMAVYMQSKAANRPIDWITSSTEKFKKGQTFPLEEFLDAETLQNYTSDQAELWYAQAYSLVNYMLNMRSRNEFYQFCVNLKNGMPRHQALYRAYGLPFTDFDVLENVWLHDLQKGNGKQ